MCNFEEYLKNVHIKSGIEFKLSWENGNIIYESSDCVRQFIGSEILLGNTKAILYVPKEQENCTPLLKFTIENKYSEIGSYKKRILTRILDGESIIEDEIRVHLPFLYKNNVILLIKLKNNYNEALNIVQNLYTSEDVFSFIYENYIVVIGNFDEPIEHAEGIKSSIEMELYSHCFISVSENIKDVNSLKKAYNEVKESLLLGEVFSVNSNVLIYKDLLFEKLAHSIDIKTKEDILSKFDKTFNKLDGEMINTLEEFVRCNLNISEAAKALYIHRNTLIYRLDKIHKETGHDIRTIKDAILLTIALLCWNEKTKGSF